MNENSRAGHAGTVFRIINRLQMFKYVLHRLMLSAVIVLGVLTLTFLMMHISGDPSSLYLRPEIDQATLENLRRQMGLNLPIEQQYLRWIREFMVGNFGVSFVQQRPVSEILKESLPNTLQLTLAVFVLQFVLGVLLGVISAIKRNSLVDVSISSISLFLYSMPGFWLALMAIMFFSLKLGWLPSSQMRSFLVTDGFWATLADRLKHLILPVAVLSAPFVAYSTRFVRGSVSEVLAQDYIRTARAYGIPSRRVLYKYTLKNALLPLSTLLGLYLPFLLGGAVVIEHVFAWPGMGRVTVNAIFTHDYPVILATTFIAAVTVVVGNLISDLLYLWVDPRIRLQGSP